nr:zinc-binding dehydrogenase [Terriglobales bacterium]
NNDNDAAPLLCAGITTFNPLRNSGARTGGVVAVQGIGGLGHLGIQYARKMGFRTVAISSGADKEQLARELGATDYMDTSKGSAADLLQKLGGADVILTTAPHSQSIAPLLGGLKPRGKLLIVAAAADPMEIVPAMLLSGKSISGWPSGSAADWEDTLSFSAENHVLPMIETFPLEKVKEAYERMMSNKARFRVVLTVS